jgi:signal transduction histidine kinase
LQTDKRITTTIFAVAEPFVNIALSMGIVTTGGLGEYPWMNDMAGKLPPGGSGDAARTLEQFAAQCAHDFNNLLTGILGNLELMQNRARRTGVTNFDSYMEGARHAAGRAADFTQRLLAFSGRAGGDPAAVSVNQLVLDIVELMREQSVAVLSALDPAAGDAWCDPAQLEFALLELLANAREAVAAGDTITLRTAAAAGQVAITVADTGAGMTPEVAARALEPFFTTRPSGAGKGLGLPIVAHFARHAGGGLTLDSAAGAGTTVILTLPLAAPNGGE